MKRTLLFLMVFSLLATVAWANDAPTIVLPDDFTFDEDSSLQVDFDLYVDDINGDPLSLTVNGNTDIDVVIDGLLVTFSGPQDWFGTETLTFTVDDGVVEAFAVDFVDVIVSPVNDEPTIELPDDFTFAEDGTLVVDFTPYLYDVDEDVLTLDYYIGGVDDNGTGTVYVSIDGLEVTFTAEQDWNGTEIVEFTVDDGAGATDATASDMVDVIVTPVNDAPVLTLPDSFTFPEEGSLVEDFTPYIFDADGDDVTLTFSDNINVTVIVNVFDVTFGNVQDWNGTENITFTLNDAVVDATGSDTVDIIVTPTNDPPTIILPDDFTFDEDDELIVDMSAYAEDIDGDDLYFSISGNTNVFADFEGMTATFTATPDWNGSENITITVSDEMTDDTAFDQVEVIVLPVNDAPTITLPDDFTMNEDSTLEEDFSAYVNDVDGDDLTLSISNNTNIFASFTDLTAFITSTQDWNGTENVTFIVDDGITEASTSDDIDIIVLPVNDAPTIVLPDSFTFPEDGSLEVDFAQYVDDVEGDPLDLTVSSNQEITVDIVDLMVTFGATTDWNGTENLTFVVNDNVSDAVAVDFVDVIVTPVNDTPTIVLPDDFTFAEDGSLGADFSQFIDDIDENSLTLSYSGNVNVGITIDGTYVTFDAAQDWNGTENIMFTVDDGVTDATASDYVDVIVTPVNDAPTIDLPADFT
ncbi:MAG: hypothetical protein B1H06_03560, partial [Candidatus Cloacimonas sp. 4484_143]